MEIIREILPQRPERPLLILFFHIVQQNHTTEECEQGKDILNLISMHNNIMWTYFIANYLDFKTSFVCADRKGPGISYSKFQKKFY